MTPETRPQRNFALDILRGVAVLLVMIRHMPPCPRDTGDAVGSVFNLLHTLGRTGVDLFFVLSGFLIAGLLFKEIERTGRLDVPRFWLRRGLKIWPSYFVAYGFMVALCCGEEVRTGKAPQALERLQNTVPNCLLVQNYFPVSQQWPNSWSLAVEEHFYLLLPLILVGVMAIFASRNPTSQPCRFTGLFLAGAAFCLGVLVLRLAEACRDRPNLYFPTHFRADSLCFGVMLGYLFHYRADRFAHLLNYWPWVLLLVALGLAAYTWLPDQRRGHLLTTHTVGFSVLFLCYGGLVALAGAIPQTGQKGPTVLTVPANILAQLGIYSYTIYLAQAIICRLPGYYTLQHRIARSVVDSDWMGRAFFLISSVAVGIVLSHLVERPMLRVRDRLFRGRLITPAGGAVCALAPGIREQLAVG
jgi:peptidoglycan/LPS O-acetylase OafA/YrhL